MYKTNEIEVENTQNNFSKARILVQNKLDFIPKISVIIPVYNTQNYLKKCLESVINQSFKEIEIICVDDGSSDDSLNILKKYAAKDKRISILSQKNHHAGVARNAGMMIACGEYYHFLDSDDWLEEGAYEKLLDSLKYDVIVFSNKVYSQKQDKYLKSTSIKKGVFTPKELSDNLFYTSSPNAWSKLFKASFIKQIKVFFEPLKIANDITFTYTAMALANKISYLDYELLTYRSEQDGHLSANRGEFMDCFLKAINALLQNLKKHSLYDEFKATFLSRARASFIYELKFYDNDYLILRKLINEIIQDDDIKSIFINELVPKISIILCAYNAANYIKTALNSLTSQTLKDIEIICVNDGSSDDTLTILNEYKNKYDYIKIIDQKNQGLSISRNNALNQANGRYIQYVDADDYIDKHACLKIFKKAFSNDLDMLMIAGANFDDDFNISQNDYYCFKYLPDDFKDVFNHTDCMEFLTKIAVSSCLSIYKNEFLKKHKITWIDKKLCYEDNLYFIQAFLKAKKVSVLKDILYFRRIHNNSITQNMDKNFKDKITIVDLLMQMLSTNATKDVFRLYFKSYTNVLYQNYNQLKNKKRFYNNLSNLYCSFLKYEQEFSEPIISTFLKKHQLSIYVNKYKKLLLQNRIDIKNYGTATNSIKIKCTNANISYPSWMQDLCGCGAKLECEELEQNISIKAINDGKLKITFSGIDLRAKNERLKLYNKYTSILIDNKQMLKKPISLWHNDGLSFSFDVKHNQIINIKLKRANHQYPAFELMQIIKKTANNNAFILQNAKKITNKIQKDSNCLKYFLKYLFYCEKQEHKTYFYIFGFKYVWFNLRKIILENLKKENNNLKAKLDKLQNDLDEIKAILKDKND